MRNRIRGFGLLCAFLSLAAFGCVQARSDGEKVAITTNSDVAREQFLQGRALFEKLRFQDARPHFEKAVAADPNFAMGHLFLALTQPSAKDFFASLKQAKSLAEQASDGERLWILGFEAGVNGDPTAQRGYYEKLVQAYPNDERALTLLGNHYFGQQQYKQAIAQYEQALQIDPEFSQPYNQLGYAYRFLGKYDEAGKAFKKYIKLIPDDPNPHDSYAELLLKIGKYDASIENYRKALEVDPYFAASHIGIATNFNLKGEHEKAREQLQKLYDTAKDNGQRRAALFAMTVSYVDEGNVDRALATLEKQLAIAENIDDSAAMAGDLANMGTILLEFGQPDAAVEKFERSVQIMRESNLSDEQKDLAEQGHLFNLTKVALEKGAADEAKRHWVEYKKRAEARKNRFQIWAAHQLAGEIATAQRDYATAVAEFEQSNLQNPYNIYKLAKAHKKHGNKAKAQELFDKAENYNALNSLPYAFMRNSARQKMSGTY